MQSNETESKPLSLKFQIGFLAVLILLGALGIGWTIKAQSDAHAQVEKARVALVAKEKVEAAQVAKIRAAKAAKLKKNRKGKNMPIVKIERGTTGQADFINGSENGAGFPAVRIDARGGATIISGEQAINNPYPYSQDGWTVDSDGTVAVPIGATNGICDMETQTGIGPYTIKAWQFEVVNPGDGDTNEFDAMPPVFVSASINTARNKVRVSLSDTTNVLPKTAVAGFSLDGVTGRSIGNGTFIQKNDVSYLFDFNIIGGTVEDTETPTLSYDNTVGIVWDGYGEGVNGASHKMVSFSNEPISFDAIDKLTVTINPTTACPDNLVTVSASHNLISAVLRDVANVALETLALIDGSNPLNSFTVPNQPAAHNILFTSTATDVPTAIVAFAFRSDCEDDGGGDPGGGGTPCTPPAPVACFSDLSELLVSVLPADIPDCTTTLALQIKREGGAWETARAGLEADAEYTIHTGIGANMKARFMSDDGTPGEETDLDFCPCYKARRPSRD